MYGNMNVNLQCHRVELKRRKWERGWSSDWGFGVAFPFYNTPAEILIGYFEQVYRINFDTENLYFIS